MCGNNKERESSESSEMSQAEPSQVQPSKAKPSRSSRVLKDVDEKAHGQKIRGSKLKAEQKQTDADDVDHVDKTNDAGQDEEHADECKGQKAIQIQKRKRTEARIDHKNSLNGRQPPPKKPSTCKVNKRSSRSSQPNQFHVKR